MDKFKQLLSNTFIFAVGNVLTKLMLFFLMPLYTTTLTTAEFGISDLLNNTIELLLPIFTLSIIEAVFRFSLDKDADHKGVLTLGLSILTIGFILIVILVSIGNYFIKYEYAWYLVFMFITYALKYLLASFTRGLGYVKIFALNGIVSTIILVILNILFLMVFNWGIHGYLLAIIISNFFGAIYLFFVAKLYLYIKINNINKKLLKEMLVFSLPNIPNLLSWWVVNISSRYIIIIFYGASIAGLFSAASKLPSMINLLSAIFQQAWQYSSSKEYGKDDSHQFFSNVFKYYSAFIMVSCSGLIMMTPFISKILLKGDFYMAWTYVPLLLFSATLGCYSVFFGTFYIASKKNFMAMISTIIGGIVNLIICFTLVPNIGVKGVLYASVLSYFVIVVIRIIDTRKYVNINIHWATLIIGLCILFCQANIIMTDIPFKLEISVFLFFLVSIIIIITIYKDIINIKKKQ